MSVELYMVAGPGDLDPHDLERVAETFETRHRPVGRWPGHAFYFQSPLRLRVILGRVCDERCCFLDRGGAPTRLTLSDGPARWLSPEDVRAWRDALDAVPTDRAVALATDPRTRRQVRLVPYSSDEERADDAHEFAITWKHLHAFVRRAAEAGDSILVGYV